MIGNYLKVALRNIIRNKGYSFINVVSLTIGMTCCILILTWVRDELNFDRFHENAGEIYRAVTQVKHSGQINHYAATCPPLAPYLKSQYPEIINTTRFKRGWEWLINYEEKAFMENRIGLADPSFFKIFSFPFIKGNPGTALSDPFSIIITEKIAVKYFGNENPMGKILRVNNGYDFTVTGVIKDIPNNSHLKFDFIVPFKIIGEERLEHWGDNDYYTYILVRKGASISNLGQKVSGVIKKHRPESNTTLYLQPLTDIHLRSNFDVDLYGPSKPKKDIYIFSLIAFFVLFIACINFMNLATARSAKRAKEVGLRKVLGAQKKDIINQFFGESFLFSLIALVFSILLADLLLPVFNNLSGKELTIYLLNKNFILMFIGIVVITGLVSGSYPAIFLSSFQPAKILKGTLHSSARSSWFRRILVVAQFSISIFLVIGTIVVYTQLSYIKSRELGYNKENLLYLRVRGNIRKNYETVKEEFLKYPGVLDVTISSDLPTQPRHLWGGLDWPGKDPKDQREIYFFTVDYDFIKTLGIKIAKGRDFSNKFSTDSTNYIINQTAAKYMGLDKPVGQWLNVRKDKGTIIGVMKDFNFKHLRSEIGPLVLRAKKDIRSYILIRMRPENIPGTIAFLETTWKKFNPGFPMEYYFLDEAFKNLYRPEMRMGELFKYFASLAIFISFLGLLGLASFIAEQRTKEIGIRKVLGSSVQGIVLLLSKEFNKWVFVANIIAWPTAYILMNGWLKDFAYRINLNLHPWIFLLAGVLSFIIASATVSYHAIKAAQVNPVESLKYE